MFNCAKCSATTTSKFWLNLHNKINHGGLKKEVETTEKADPLKLNRNVGKTENKVKGKRKSEKEKDAKLESSHHVSSKGSKYEFEEDEDVENASYVGEGEDEGAQMEPNTSGERVAIRDLESPLCCYKAWHRDPI
jgi:hypothetical protein